MSEWGIRRRLMVLALMPAALMALVLAAYFTHSRIKDLDEGLRLHGMQMVKRLAPAFEYGVISGNRAVLDPLVRNLLTTSDVQGVAVFDAVGRAMLKEGKPTFAEGRSLAERFVGWYSDLPGVISFRAPIQPTEIPLGGIDEQLAGDGGDGRGETVGWVEVELTTAPTVARQVRVVVNSFWISLAGLLLSAVVASRAGRQVSEPIMGLTSVVRAMEKGQLDVRVERDAGGELGALQQGVNSMAAALEGGREEMRSRIEHATRELRETLEAVEMQNVELDIARKRALEASRVKSDFLSSMSHEIRTPMNGIIGFSNLLLRTDMSSVQQEYVQTINESATSLLSIINDILDFSKIESGRLKLETVPFDLREVVDDALVLLAPLAYDKGLELVKMIYSDVPVKLLGDPVRIRQVLTNLVGNAIKFTADGSVAVRVMLEDEDSRHVLLRVAVADTGVGIAEQQQRGLFQAFSQVDASVTRRFGGTGLGLAISKQLVLNMQGDIGVESVAGEGATFWFTIRCEKQLEEVMAGEGEKVLNHCRGLICDPHLLARMSIRHALSGWGMEVTDVEAWGEVAQRLRDNPGANVLVCGMPRSEAEGGRFGVLLDEWRSIRPGLRVVALVNSVDQTVQERLRSEGVDLVLPKLGRHDTLRRELQRLLRPESLAEPVRPEPEETAGRLAGIRLLVVDDNPVNLTLATTLLRERGAEVEEAENGEEAVERAARRRYDLILMDIQMPGISGVEAAREIRANEGRGRRTPIIALTAHALAGERERFIEAGMDDCLIKPLDEEALWSTIERWNGSGSAPVASEGAGQREVAPVGTSLPAYDRGVAVRLAGGNEALADRLLDMLLRDLDSRHDQIRAAFTERKWEELRNLVHKLHGSAANCGTPALQHAARWFETALVDGELEGLERHMEALGFEVERLMAERGTLPAD